MQREFDICLHGATGYTGRLVAHHLFRRCGEEGVRWAISGRDPRRLAALVTELSSGAERVSAGEEVSEGAEGSEGADGSEGARSGSPPVVITADSGDPAALEALAARCRVVCSTVGPYARFGTDLVRACVEQGASYLDLTGEVHWMRGMIDRFGEAADRAGVAIVHASGFDSIPSDIGVLVARQEAQRRHGEEPRALRLQVDQMSGGVSRGTLDSMVALAEEALRNREVRAIIADPRSLTPGWSAGRASQGRHSQGRPDRRHERSQSHKPEPRPRRRPLGRRQFRRRPQHVGTSHHRSSRQRHRLPSGQWVMPFFMDSVNGRVVRRSIALSAGTEWAGELPAYREVVCTGTGLRGFARALLGRGALAVLSVLILIPPTRRLLQKTVFPAPGGGPTADQRARGHFRITIHDEEREEALATIVGNRDPGYGATAIMLGEAALLLAGDSAADSSTPRSQPERPTGVITPAIAYGTRIVPRLARQGIVIAAAD